MSEDLKRYDLAEIRKAVGVLFADVKFGEGECVEVRVPDKKKHLVAAGWFDNIDLLAKNVALLARDGFGSPGSYRHIHENAYWTCNPVHDALLARQPKNTIDFAADTSSDANITRRLWLPLDIDPLRPSGVSATRSERRLALEVANNTVAKLTELGFPDTCFVGGCSGNGYHVLLRIDLPNDNDSRDLLKKCLAALQGLVGTGKVEIDPKVYNAARIIKCYGTLSCKGVNTEDRPWTWSKLTVTPEAPLTICPKELLEKLAALAPEKNPKRDLGQKRQGPWTIENTQAYLDWTPWGAGEQRAGGQPNETAKWIGPCIVDSNHGDSAIILHTDGWWSYGCFHAGCSEANHKAFMAKWEEENGEKYPYPGGKPVTEDFTGDFLEPEGPEPEEKIELKSFNLTDAGNTERLLHRFGHLFRYCPEQDWFCWDGQRWVPDSKGKVYRGAIRVVRLIPEEASLLPKESEDAISDTLKWAKASEGRGHIDSMVDMATWMGNVANITEFDADKWAFNLANGTLDLRSNEFRKHNQEDKITNVSPVLYDPKAECPLWMQFLDEVMLGDQELIAFLQRASGYSLTGITAAHCVFMLYGTGRNGKSTFLEVLRFIIGTYCKAAAMETFMAKNQEGIPNDLAALRDARFVSAIETEESRRLNESKIKLVTGGDTISARFLHREFFNFVPQFKIWFATNHRPIIRGTDEGIWSRIRLVPFKLQIPEGRRDEKMVDKLKSEASGILNWMLQGLDDYKLSGLCEPERVSQATEEYRKAEDWLQRFLDSETIPATGPEHRTQARDVYARFKTWAEDAKEYVQPERKFNDAMEAHGEESSKLHNKKMYHLLLKPSTPAWQARGERALEPEEVM